MQVLSVEQISARVRRLKSAASARDARMTEVAMVRAGEAASIWPSLFSEDYPRSVAANFIDVVAHDLSEMMAPLPTLICGGSSMSAAEKNRQSKRTNIGLWYWHHSDLSTQMFRAADQYLTYGFLPLVVEPDYDEDSPVIYAVDPMGCYPAFDRMDRCVGLAQSMRLRAEELADMYPELAGFIYDDNVRRYDDASAKNEMLEVIRWYDKDQTIMFVPQRSGLVLDQVEQPLNKCPAVIIRRPSLDGQMRGQFDDAIPVQLARAKMALLGLEAAEKSVQAPLALPDDVTQLPFGPDAVIRTRSPEKVRRVGLELPPGAFQESESLENELRAATRYPGGRSGDLQANVITGRGIQALMGTLDTQIKTAQELLSRGLARITQLAFELDTKCWPNKRKTINAVFEGQSFTETYVPSRDIKDDFRCDCVYGFAAGLNVNQAVVMIEQMRADKLIDRTTARRHLPLGEDVIKLERAVNAEMARDGLMQGVTAMAQSANVMIEQGQDPSAMLMKLAQIIQDLQKGDNPEDAIGKAFAPPPPAPDTGEETGEAPPGQTGQGAPGGDGGTGGAPPGMSDLTGLPMNTAAAGQAPGGRPTLQTLMAGLSPSGNAQMGDNIQRRIPA